MRIGFLLLGMLFLAGCASSQEEVKSTDTRICSLREPTKPWDLENNIGDRVHFDVDSIVFNLESQRTLERQAAWLKQFPEVRITVEGHADERGTREYNLALGERRASAVKNYLVASGIEASRIFTISYGKERPAMLGDTQEAWAQNRRAVTTVD
ncbi:MAG: peptidoglycan-associated lipoprotein Pal [Alphaproteobacteria bacterium]|nr:peptidoglycan-associated lipoprotein Pal [Alphaproteobacteria bacterium]